jgi:hypothetical protein
MTYAAGTNSPWGFRPERHINGSSWNGQTKIFRIASAYATSLYTGDPVTQNGNGTITIATAGANPIIGIFMGVKYIDASGNPQYSQYWPANTSRLLLQTYLSKPLNYFQMRHLV